LSLNFGSQNLFYTLKYTSGNRSTILKALGEL
jgi:hypothetical protein